MMCFRISLISKKETIFLQFVLEVKLAQQNWADIDGLFDKQI